MPLFQGGGGAGAAGGAGGYVQPLADNNVIRFNAVRPNNNNDQLRRREEEMLARERRDRMLRPFDLVLDDGDALYEEIERQELQEMERQRINRLNRIDMSEVEEVMKVRHLNKGERDMYHNPKPDWHDSKKGDVCKNAVVLEVEDIIRKHIK